MKRLAFLALALTTFTINACDEAPPISSAIEEQEEVSVKNGAGIMTTASPAIAFIDTNKVTVRRTSTYYNAIKVMDADGANTTVIYRGARTDASANVPTYLSPYGMPSWSTGGSGTSASPWRLTFTEQSAGTPDSRSVKTIDVSVNSSGVPVGGNVQTVKTYTDGSYIYGSSWRPGANEIAYTRLASPTGSGGYAEVYKTTLAGVATRVYPLTGNPSGTEMIRWVTWSSTGDSIAFSVLENQADNNASNDYGYVKIIKADGTVVGSYGVSYNFNVVHGLHWGANGEIAFAADSLVSGVRTSQRVYSLDPSTGTITKQFQGATPCWIDGTSMLYASGGIKRQTIGASSATTLTTSRYIQRPSYR